MDQPTTYFQSNSDIIQPGASMVNQLYLFTVKEGDLAQWLERLTASPVMHASRVRSPLILCGVFR